MLFLTLSNTDIQFAKKKLIWRSYTVAEALPTTKRVKIINKKEFAKAALDENVEAFIVHVTFFSLSLMLLKITKLNQHAIKLQEGQQPPYRPIYSLGPWELKTLKTYIKTNLASGFIWPLKSLAGASILFVWKPDGNFRLCVDYQSFNNPTIKNQYLLPLISELLDRLGQAKRFT